MEHEASDLGGFLYQPDFLTAEDEQSLVERIAAVEFTNFEMRGVVARRRVAFFGRSYEGAGRAAPPLTPFLIDLRTKVGARVHRDPAAFVMALINEYPPGAAIGWHRDAPQYDIVAGISLLSSCRMKFRPYARPGQATGQRRTATHEYRLEPRSIYLLAGESRTAYEHHIPATAALRYSITFRTLRERRQP
jgi:alkylated DNA repair dioxygenase AlkB